MPRLADDLLFDNDPFWKALLVALALGIAGTYAGLLSLPTLVQNWGFARGLGYFCAGTLALGGRASRGAADPAAIVASTPPAPNSGLYGRVAYCPVCGAALGTEPVWGADHECTRCLSGFRVEVTQGRKVF